jgi:hypothetical protein
MARPTLFVDGQKIDAEITGRLTSCVHIRTMEGASSLELTVDDHDGEILRGGLLSKPGHPTRRQRRIANFDQAAWARFGESRLITEDGWFTRLAGVDPSYDAASGTLGMTFEDEAASLMRHATKAIKSRRGSQTRAQFIGMLLGIAYRRADFGTVPFFSPEESVEQRVKKPDVAHLKKGLSKKTRLTIKRVPITPAQRHNLETALGIADDLGASEKAMLAMLVAGIGESGWQSIMNQGGSPYGGVLQGNVGGGVFKLDDVAGMVRCFLLGGKGFQGGGAIHLAATQPDWLEGEIALTVEGSVSNFGSRQKGIDFYHQWISEARDILSAWGGASQVQLTRERYSYRAGGRRRGEQHNYWDDAGELATEVRWRLYADSNVVYYVSDEWLFTRRPELYIDQGVMSSGVLSIQATADVGMPIAEFQVIAANSDWNGAPGAVVEVDDLGPLDGRWLIWRNEFDRLAEQSTLTLRRPAPKKAEPAPSVRRREVTTQDVDPTQVSAEDLHGTPKDIIDNLVLPVARQHGLKTPFGLPLTPANNDAANRAHTHLGSASDHAGPPSLKWAADCTNGTSPTKQMDAFAKDIKRMFGAPNWQGLIQWYRSGYRFQLIYRYSDPQAGNHYNHVHVGIRLER